MRRWTASLRSEGERCRMNEAQRRTNGGRSHLYTTEESIKGERERMTNDQKGEET